MIDRFVRFLAMARRPGTAPKAAAAKPPLGLRRTVQGKDLGWVAVGLLVLIAASPLFQPGLPDVADAPIHLFRTAEWVRSWQAGILVPRWSPTLAYGYGYPLFVFAPPLPYAFAGALHLLGFSLTTSIKLLSIGCLAVAGSGIYLLIRSYWGPPAALVAASAYLLAPFMLREAYIYGGNYPQLLAISLFPLILWAFHRLGETGRAAYLLLAAGCYGALMLSHNFHALIFTPFLALFVLGEALFLQPHPADPPPRERHPAARHYRFRARLGQASLAWLLGLGWTAYFWLPALVERQWTRAQEEIYVATSPFYLRFLDLRDLLALPAPLDSRAANPDMPFSLGIAIAGLAGLGTLVALSQKGKRWPALLFTGALLGAVFMMLPASEWLWANVPLLAVAEFPWRLMGLAALCSAALAGLGMTLICDDTLWPRTSWAGILPAVAVLVIILASAVYLYPPKPFVSYGPGGTPSLADQVRYERNTGTIGSTTLGEYLSVWVTERPYTSPLVPDLLAGRPVEKLDRSELPPGVKAQLLAHTPTLDRYAFAADEPFTAHFYTFYFPGWRATIDDQPTDLRISKPYGLIEIPIPAGQHTVTLQFKETPLRIAANLISLLSLLASAALAIIRRQKTWDTGTQAVTRATLSETSAAILLSTLAILFLGKVFLIDPGTWFRRQSPPGEVLGAAHKEQIALDDKVLFLGYDLDRDVVRAGQRVRLTLYWQALERISENYSVFVHLDAPPEGTTFLTADNNPPGDPQAQIDIPTSHWQPPVQGYKPPSYIRDEHRFTIPKELPPVMYTVRVGLYDPVTGEGLGDAINLQRMRVLPAVPLVERDLPNPIKARLGDSIELLGYQVEAGSTPSLTLYWRAREGVERDYSVFVHIVDGTGKMVDQRDGPPLGGMYATSDWFPGQIVADRRELPDLPEGGQILTGMYELTSLQRLPAQDERGQRFPDDAVPLSIRP